VFDPLSNEAGGATLAVLMVIKDCQHGMPSKIWVTVSGISHL
jgi:hypothetical protein